MKIIKKMFLFGSRLVRFTKRNVKSLTVKFNQADNGFAFGNLAPL